MNQVILVDNKDKELGYSSIEKTHTGQGMRHRAFVTLLYNSKNQVLLQRRRHRLFDGLWDLTAVSHPLHIKDHNESYQEASDRALKKEMGVGHVVVRKVGGFNYFARDRGNCENEYCAVLVGKWDGKQKTNPKEVYGARWVDFGKFLKDIKVNPKKYTLWAVLALKEVEGEDQEAGFEHTYRDFLAQFEKYSKSHFAKLIKKSAKYPELIRKFYDDLADFTAGGKKMRAFLVYLGFLLGRNVNGADEGKRIFPVSLAAELVHSFLLIHDDIIDKSETRRNKPTIHKRYEKIFGSHYGASQAIVLGDIACFEAFNLINSSDFGDRLKILCQEKLYQVLLETAYGEALDVEYSHRKAKITDIWQVADLKTARYSFVGPLTLGALLAGSTRSQIDAISKFGFSAGIAFQLQDDYLGVFGDEEILGKSVLSDMREGKNTLLIYKTRELANLADGKIVDNLWGKVNATLADLIRVKKIITKCGADIWCQRKMRSFAGQAKKKVGYIIKDKKLSKILVELADFTVNRER